MIASSRRSRVLLSASLIFVVCCILYNTHIIVTELFGASIIVKHHKAAIANKGSGGDPPPWFTKYDYVTQSAQQHASELSQMPDICFLHVGKTAGTSLRCAFGFLEGFDDCRNATIPNGFLPLATTHLVHNELNFCPAADDKKSKKNNNMPLHYLFATRNPLHRIVSWYTYEYPRLGESPQKYENKYPLYFDCPFGTLEDLAVRGLGPNNTASTVCRQRAWDAIHGYERYDRHNYFNYRYYLSQVPNNEQHQAPWYVIRTEHLVKDWNSIEEHLVSSLNNNKNNIAAYKIDESAFPRSNPTPQDDRQSKNISPQAQELLCEALCDEIQIYKKILRRAINLSRQDVEVSFQELAQGCHKQTYVEECPPEERPVVQESHSTRLAHTR